MSVAFSYGILCFGKNKKIYLLLITLFLKIWGMCTFATVLKLVLLEALVNNLIFTWSRKGTLYNKRWKPKMFNDLGHLVVIDDNNMCPNYEGIEGMKNPYRLELTLQITDSSKGFMQFTVLPLSESINLLLMNNWWGNVTFKLFELTVIAEYFGISFSNTPRDLDTTASQNSENTGAINTSSFNSTRFNFSFISSISLKKETIFINKKLITPYFKERVE